MKVQKLLVEHGSATKTKIPDINSTEKCVLSKSKAF
jgi:hypothetical protein